VALAGCVTRHEGEGQPLCLRCHPVHYAERGSCTDCHRGNDRTERREIAHAGLIPAKFAWFALDGSAPVAEGRKLLETFACRRCHVAGGKGNRLATDLDTLLARGEPARIAAALRQPALAMPDFRLAEGQVTLLVNAILAGGRRVPPAGREVPQVVHFSQEGEENVFAKRCGPCHRAISERHGLLGRGEVAPNLSGLLSPFYPKSFSEGEPWTDGRLRKWLDNPRAVRPNARMQPVRLERAEFDRLVETLRVSRSSTQP
jgi:cytochrome c2